LDYETAVHAIEDLSTNIISVVARENIGVHSTVGGEDAEGQGDSSDNCFVTSYLHF
jgi:hypothetical protein